MISSRLSHALIMLFWISFLALLALVTTYAPQGGVELAGLSLFANAGLVDAMVAAMGNIGLSAVAQSVIFGLVGGFNIAAAGFVLFAMMFYVLGQEREQREARPLAEGAAACTAAAAMLTVAVCLAGGRPGALMVLELAVLGGQLLMLTSFAGSTAAAETMDMDSHDLEGLIADHAANHAAFSAQLASISRRGTRS